MNTEAIITAIRNIIADNTDLALSDVYSPELPQDKENVCAVTLLGGSPEYCLSGMQIYNMNFRVLIRGTTNDTSTRALSDSIFNALNLKSNIESNGATIIQILATNIPTFVGKDEELRNLYNVIFNLKGR